MNNNHFLPADVCRCDHSDCPLKEGCLRWLCREGAYYGGSFHEALQADGSCDFQIPLI